MNTLIQILTLQNGTFNAWAYGIGTVILLIVAGMNFEEDRDEAFRLIFIALVWPFFLCSLLIVGIVAISVWLGKTLNGW